MGWSARIVAGLAFLLTAVPLGGIAFATLSIRCCEARGSGTELAGWIIIGLVVLAAALVAAALAGGLVEIICRAVARHKGRY